MDGGMRARDLAKPRLGGGVAGLRNSNELPADATPELAKAAHSAWVGRRANEKALLMPDATLGNPYQRQLAEALGRFGVEVAFANPAGVLPLLSAVADHAPVEILHLHWTHQLVVADGRLKSVVKAVRFIMELAWLRLRGVRLVWTAHNLLEHEQRHPGIELFFGRIAERLYHRIIVHCDVARCAVAQTYRISPRRQHKLHTIPHGHFIGTYPNTVSQNEARLRLGIGPARPVLVHFGQIRPYKGVFELLDAFERLDAPSAVLLIAGRPWDEATAGMLRVRARRDPRIRLYLGFVPDDEVQIYLNAADVVVLPYRDVLTSGSAMLAMSFGRAVVMPRCGCAEEMMGGEQGAVLYDAADTDSGLDRALQRALNMDLAAMGKRNHERAASFGWEAIASLTAHAYRGRKAR